MIELKNLDKTFQDIHAVDHISGSIREGMVFGLIGSNGAGKSTLLRMISGIIRPDSGEVLVDGKPVYENPEIKSQICFLSDSPYYFPNADIRQMRDYYAMIYPSFNRKLFDSLTEKFKLESKRKISSFSKGMKKQVSILLGICSGTRYLLCDETFDGLDPVIRQAVKSLFASEIMNRDFTPVISSHNLRELEDICDSIGLLHQGKTSAHTGSGSDQVQHLQTPVCHPRLPQGAGTDPPPADPPDGAHRLPSDPDRAGRPHRSAETCSGTESSFCGGPSPYPGRNIYQ